MSALGSKADIFACLHDVRFTPESDIDCVFRHVRYWPKADVDLDQFSIVSRSNQASSELIQQRPRVLKIRAVEPLGEPTVGGSKQLVCCSMSAQFVPKPGEARGGT